MGTAQMQDVPVILDEIRQKCNPVLVGYGGSISYGTNLPTSDVDIRGIYMNPVDEFIGMNNSEQYQLPGQDTTIYSIRKAFNLLLNCNPNVIEMLGLKPEHYLLLTKEGEMILENRKIFLSKRAAKSFGGYAKAQLNRLMNRSGRALEQLTANEARSMQKAICSIKDNEKVKDLKAEEVDGKLYISMNESLEVDKFFRIVGALQNVHNDYRDSSRNTKAAENSKLPKHMMHLVRLYIMALDILERQEIVTYREAEHDLLMDIRNGKYLEEDGLTPTKEFSELLQYYEEKFEYAQKHTELPDAPNYKAANELMMECVRKFYSSALTGGCR